MALDAYELMNIASKVAPETNYPASPDMGGISPVVENAPQSKKPGAFKAMLQNALQAIYDGNQHLIGNPDLERQKLAMQRERDAAQIRNWDADNQRASKEFDYLNEPVTVESDLTGLPKDIQVRRREYENTIKAGQNRQMQLLLKKMGIISAEGIADKKIEAGKQLAQFNWGQRWGLEKFKEAGRNGRAQMSLRMAMDGSFGAAADVWADAIANNEAKLTDVPKELRGSVLYRRTQNGQAFIPAAVRTKLSEFDSARGSIGEMKKYLEKYLESGNPADGLMFRSKLKGFGTMVGRSVGNKGVFTDQDQDRIETLLSPIPVLGAMGAPLAPEMSREALDGIMTVLDDIQSREFSSYMNRVDRGTAKPKGGGSDTGGTVRIQLSDGRTGSIPKSSLQKYINAGAKVIN